MISGTQALDRGEPMAKESLFRAVGTKGRLVDRVVSEIQGLIVGGRLEAGTRLPPERELAEELGVSRTVIREAVRILMTKGLLETRPGVGTIVRHLTRDQIVEPLSLLVQIRDGDISFEQLHQVRSILEVEIAGVAALQATEEDITNLRQIMADMEASQDDPDVFAARDTDFHQGLAQTTHNPLLTLLLGVIRDLLEEYMTVVTRYLDVRQQVLPYHYEILEKVAAKDEEGARQAMREHLKQIRKNHETAFSRQLSEGILV
jgi:GntR family transcriptional repressor for pyruvate dehydrogenase complex